MVIEGGYTKDLTLKNIPEAFNGWKVYCKFSNDSGSSKTEKATVTVATDIATLLPKVTKSPTGETVQPGGAATFVARHDGAYWAEWHFVSPDGRDITYNDAKEVFPSLTITGGDQGTLKLGNIPAELNGWKVYCKFSNNAGAVNTDTAAITVQGQTQTAAAQTNTAAPAFEGRWVEPNAGRCQLTFTYAGEGSVRANVVWSGSAYERACWDMTASAYKDMMVYDSGHAWTETWSDDSHYTVSNESYNASGSFYFVNGRLVWYNDQTGEEVTMVPG
jgi:hypothetical protein